MPRKLSALSPDWWDYTTIDSELVAAVARLTPRDLEKLSRPGFRVVMYDSLEEFYLAEALEYIHAWRQSTEDNPVGICGPIGPTEQLRSSRAWSTLSASVCTARISGAWTNGFCRN